MVVRLCSPIHKVPVSLWSEFHGVLTFRSDCCQMALYQVYYFGFVTAVLKVMPTDVDGGGEVYFVVMLGVFTRGCDRMVGHQLAKIIEYHTGIHFLNDRIFFTAVEVD